MRVAHVIPALATRTGGPAVGTVESVRALAPLGIESTIFATDLAAAASSRRQRRASRADLPAGVDAVDARLYPARRPHRVAFSPALDRALAGAVGSYDVVHIHSLYLYPQLAGFRAAKRHRVPYIVSPHGALDPFLRQRGRARKALTELLWQRRMLEGAAALHLTTDGEAALVADVAPAVPRAVVPNGIRWDEFQGLPSARSFRERHLGGHDGPLVMFLGRITFKKGIDVLVRAFALVAHEEPDCRLAIVGPDDEGRTPSLEAIAERAGVRDRVHFVEMVTGAERLAALAAADVWALPSHTENFGIAVAEALAAGRAVVVSPAVNIAGDIEHADAGIVCEPAVEPLAAQLLALLHDEPRRLALGERARAFARRYDWSAVAGRAAAMYEEALA